MQRGRADIAGGLIPARAGNTHHEEGSSRGHWAHPRSRGEHGLIGIMGLVLLGSSPLARGTRILDLVEADDRGLIPARAGNTPPHHVQGKEPEAHPRSRGEHRLSSLPVKLPPGSSPLARGTRPLTTLSQNLLGLIPARAGNT